MSCPSWQWHRTGSRWFPVRTLPVAPLWCGLGFVPNSQGNKAAAMVIKLSFYKVISASSCERNSSAHGRTIHSKIRNRLDPATTEKPVHVYSNIKLVASNRDADKLKGTMKE